ncbi:hypothetical protein [Methylobacterium sp. A54F]
MSPPQDHESGQPTGGQNANPPPVELYPMTDIRFVLVRIGELGAKVDRLVDDVSSQSKKIDEVRGKIKFVQGAIWVLGSLLTIAAGVFIAYLSGKFKITFK